MHIDDVVTARTADVSVEFGRLRGDVWEQIGIRLDTKLKVYKAVVLPTLLYACETWTVYQRHAKRLNHSGKTLKTQVARQDPRYRGPEEGRDAKRTYPLKLAQLRWTGRVTIMPNERLPKTVFCGELQKRKHS